MFDSATLDRVFGPWEAWQDEAQLNAGAYGDLSDPPGRTWPGPWTCGTPTPAPTTS